MTYDKCNICLWEGPSDEVIFEEPEHWYCPRCGSEDVDDASYDPYEEEEEDDYEEMD